LSEHDARARVARGVTYLFIQGLANSVLGVVYFIILSRALADKPEEMGVFALLVFVLALPQVFGILALNQAAVKYMPHYLAQGNLDKASSIVTRLLQVGVISSAAAFVLIFIPAEWLSSMLFSTVDYAPLLRIIGIASVFNILFVLASCFLQALQKLRDMAILGFVYTLVQNVLGIGLLYLGWRLYAAVYGWLAGLAFGAIVGLILTAKHIGLLGRQHELKPLLQYSMPLYVANGITFFVGWVDQLILVTYMSLLYGDIKQAQTLLGVYYVAIRASVVPSLFSNSIITALFPKLSELYSLQGSEGLKDTFRISTRYAVLIGFPLIIGLATLAHPAIILFAGQKYIGAVEPLIIICIGALAVTLGVAVGPILLALERTTIVSVLSTVSVLLSLVLSYFALAYLGLGTVGTAWARSIAAIIGVILTIYAVKPYVRVSFDKEALWKGSLASALMVLAIFAVDLIRRTFSPASGFLDISLRLLPIYIALGGITYAVALAKLRAIKQQDMELVKGYVPKRFRQVVVWLERYVVAD